MTSDNQELRYQRGLVAALCSPARYPHAVGNITVIETHISFVLLTGTFAYKIKKSIDLGFLDFTTLAKRRFCCEEELRLNGRLAPRIYLETVAISGTAAEPRVGGEGEAIEYAVKMIEFPQENLLDRVLQRAALTPRHLDALAMTVAAFHDCVARVGPASEYGGPESVLAPVEQNFAQLRALPGAAEDHETLETIEAWSSREYRRLGKLFANRKQMGFVRECHGDLHLGNIALLDEDLQVFDCIEFNPLLRWIDVLNEVAFLVMDLSERGRPDYASRFLNDYLEIAGDYAGLRVLPFYLVYRAMVRAKIARMRAGQEGVDAEARRAALETYAAYVAYARRIIEPRRCAVIITHGLSGSGKTFLAQAVLEAFGAVRIRSDLERKRLHGLPAAAHSGSEVGAGLYNPAATRATYDTLAELARDVIGAGYPVVVDATFLKRRQRDKFRALAGELGVPFLILDCDAPVSVLQQRIAARRQTAADASEATPAVLDQQLRTAESLTEGEAGDVLSIDTTEVCIGELVERVRRKLWEPEPIKIRR
jgi:aminoglycoside phosphotransferase family enzyme/predicted kinase